LVTSMLRSYVIRRLGEPDDAAALILFLASDAASWITGQTYPVNGGYSFAMGGGALKFDLYVYHPRQEEMAARVRRSSPRAFDVLFVAASTADPCQCLAVAAPH